MLLLTIHSVAINGQFVTLCRWLGRLRIMIIRIKDQNSFLEREEKLPLLPFYESIVPEWNQSFHRYITPIQLIFHRSDCSMCPSKTRFVPSHDTGWMDGVACVSFADPNLSFWMPAEPQVIHWQCCFWSNQPPSFSNNKNESLAVKGVAKILFSFSLSFGVYLRGRTVTESQNGFFRVSMTRSESKIYLLACILYPWPFQFVSSITDQ